jgi:hypothetical protein
MLFHFFEVMGLFFLAISFCFTLKPNATLMQIILRSPMNRHVPHFLSQIHGKQRHEKM